MRTRRTATIVRSHVARALKRVALELLIGTAGLLLALVLVHRVAEAAKADAARVAQHDTGIPGR